MKLSNEEVLKLMNEIDKYEDPYDFLITRNTKITLKNLLISGADPTSNNFSSKFPDEYHLWRKVRHALGYLA